MKVALFGYDNQSDTPTSTLELEEFFNLNEIGEEEAAEIRAALEADGVFYGGADIGVDWRLERILSESEGPF